MIKKNIFSALIPILFVCHKPLAQSIQILNDKGNISFRGLSVVNDNLVWASGTNGTVAKTSNGGKTWEWLSVKGFEKTDFRDIEAFDDKNAIIMGVASPAYILKTTDGGKNWTMVYENKDTAMFLDAMDFWDQNNGVVVGDPINNKPFVATTKDGGKTWAAEKPSKLPTFANKEAFFAASGTNVTMTSEKDYAYVSGGAQSKLYIKNKPANPILLMSGKETTGANSLAFANSNYYIVGGDFDNSSRTDSSFSISNKKSFINKPLSGYKSCIEILSEKQLIACGTTGVDISKNNGDSFTKISEKGFHTVQKAKDGKAVYLAGPKGLIGKLVL